MCMCDALSFPVFPRGPVNKMILPTPLPPFSTLCMQDLCLAYLMSMINCQLKKHSIHSALALYTLLTKMQDACDLIVSVVLE